MLFLCNITNVGQRTFKIVQNQDHADMAIQGRARASTASFTCEVEVPRVTFKKVAADPNPAPPPSTEIRVHLIIITACAYIRCIIYIHACIAHALVHVYILP